MDSSLGLTALTALIALSGLIWLGRRLWLRAQLFRDKQLSAETDRAQRELENYLKSEHSIEEIGRMFERQIGYMYEADGFDVQYNGCEMGLQDRGRDLIIRKDGEVLIVQAKCWSKKKLIPLNQIYQLYGSAKDFEVERCLPGEKAKAVFFAACRFSPDARAAAKRLGIELINLNLDKSYPMIKCHTTAAREMLYLLPTDAAYDFVKLSRSAGDFYTSSAAEAALKGYRRTRSSQKAA